MKNLRRLGLCVTFVCLLATVVVADGPLCEPPAPGTVNSPPCAAAQIVPDNTDASESAAPESSAAEAWVAEVTIDLIESVLSIF